VNRVVPPEAIDPEIAKLCEAIIDKTPVAVAAGKRTFYEQLETGLEQAYDVATQSMVCNMMTDDAAEGIDAFAAKRKPVWRGK
jgi:enoyl-CoA hydratase/carnithine racemase